MVAIIVHGGAGKFRPEMEARAREGCERAARFGHRMLSEGAAALDVVEKVVNLLEDDPAFNAGTGANANVEGEIELDAIIVDGATLGFGAVAGVRNVRNPVSVARRVMEATPHCLLAGEGATRFARESGFEFVPTEALAGASAGGPEHGTVGAVALDARGHIAAATSTGGTKGKMPGRVGDSPLIGCGAMADDGAGGASATGHGEALMKVMMARTVCEAMLVGRSAGEAARHAVGVLARRVGGEGGVICLDPQGRIGFAYNTTHLAAAGVDGAGRFVLQL